MKQKLYRAAQSLLLAVIVTTLFVRCVGNESNPVPVPPADSDLTDAEKAKLLERAYVYTLPLMLIDATFIKMTNTVEPSIFHLYFRIYNPVERISNNEWTMPAIMRID